MSSNCGDSWYTLKIGSYPVRQLPEFEEVEHIKFCVRHSTCTFKTRKHHIAQTTPRAVFIKHLGFYKDLVLRDSNCSSLVRVTQLIISTANYFLK